MTDYVALLRGVNLGKRQLKMDELRGLAANLGYLFTDRGLVERIDAAAAAGFKAIELQFPYDVPAAEVKGEIELG